MYDFAVGDQVVHKDRTGLHCGTGIYPCAYVVSVSPLVLVSAEGDMRWNKMDSEQLIFAGSASKAEMKKPLRMFASGH